MAVSVAMFCPNGGKEGECWEPWGGEGTYSSSGGPDTVEHVCAESDGYDEVFRVADAHYVSGFMLW